MYNKDYFLSYFNILYCQDNFKTFGCWKEVSKTVGFRDSFLFLILSYTQFSVFK